MRSISRLVGIAAFGFAIFIGALSSANASTTYTYTGNDFRTCGALVPNCTSDNVTAKFTTTLTETQLSELDNADISSTITSFSISSLTLNFTQDDFFHVLFTTNIIGDPIDWSVSGCPNNVCSTAVQTNHTQEIVYDQAVLCGFDCIVSVNSSGIWDVSVSSVPEPTTWAMLLLGFGSIGFVMRKRRANTALA